VQRSDHVVVLGTHQDLLQEVVGDNVLDDDLVTCHRVVERQPWTAVLRRRAEFLARERITPLAECPFRKLHDVALVHEGHGGEVTIDAMLDGFSYQALRAFLRSWLYADPCTGGE